MNKKEFVSRYHIKSKKHGRAVKIAAIEYVGGTLQSTKYTKKFIGYPDKLMEVMIAIPASDTLWREQSLPAKESGSYQHIKDFANNDILYVHRCKVIQKELVSEKLSLWFKYFRHYKGYNYQPEPKDKDKIEACDYVNQEYLTVYFKGHKADYWEFRQGTISNFTSKKNAIHSFIANEREKLNNPHGFKPEPTANEYFRIKDKANKTAYLAYYKKKGYRLSWAADGMGSTIPKWNKLKPVQQLASQTSKKLQIVK